MITRAAISLLLLGSLAVAASYLAVFVDSGALAPWLLAIGATAVLAGLGLLGAGERSPRLAAAVLVACASTFAGFAIALSRAAPAAGGPLLFGLPLETALLLVLVGLVPLVMLPLAYAWAFPHEVADRD